MAGIEAPRFSDPSTVPSYIAVEDFGTVGLTGDQAGRSSGNFHGFFYRHGVTGKTEGSLGSRGLGKLVMTMSSRFHTKFAVSRPEGADAPWTMGMATLYHRVDDGGTAYAPHMHWGRLPADERPQPVFDSAVVERMIRTFKLDPRTSSHGLSVVIPFPRSGLDEDALVRAVLANHYFQILRREVVVHVNAVEISRSTFDNLARTHVPDILTERRLAFLHEVLDRLETGAEPHVLTTLGQARDTYLGEDGADVALDILADERLLHVRAPFSIRSRAAEQESSTHVDCFYIGIDDGEEERWAQYARGGLVISSESKKFKGQALAMLVAPTGPETAGALLRSAENSAHTLWSERERVDRNWHDGWTRTKQMRHSLQKIWNLVHAERDRELPDLPNDILFIRDAEARKSTSGRRRRKKTGPPPDLPKPRPPLFSLTRIDGGFRIRPGTGAPSDASEYPCDVRVRVAYDTMTGNPFRSWSAVDFDLSGRAIAISGQGFASESEDNVLRLSLENPQFDVSVSGFDVNRDLLVDARRYEP